MDHFNAKNVTLSDPERNEILGRYLTMTNKLSFSYFKDEIEGLKQ